MALLWLVKNLGKVLASLEESKVEFLCNFVGDFFYWIPNSRTRTILSNLKYAFPEKTDREIHRIARKNCRNLVEYGALALAATSKPRHRALRAASGAGPRGWGERCLGGRGGAAVLGRAVAS